MTTLKIRSVLATILLVAMAACGEEPEVVQQEQKLAPPEESRTALWPGPWRLTIELQGKTLPLQMEVVDRDDGVPAVYYINGEERVKVPRVEIDGNKVLLEMTAYDTRITGTVDNGVLTGELHKKKRDETQVMPVRADYGEQYRFFQTMAPPEAELGGRWAVTFTDDDGNETEAVAEFEQQGTQLEGTILTPTGDYRFLAGEVRNGQLFLSTYDGAHVFLFEASYDKVEDRLSGDFWSGAAWHEDWVAERDPAAELPDADAATFLREGYDSFEFTFPNLEGEPVSLDDPKFDDKVVIVQLAGSWCPNCGDETRFLAPWYEENRERGVEVIALMFEYYEDFDAAAEQVRKWRDEFGVEYTTLVAGTSEKDVASEALPQLNAVLAYPTTIFIDRDGKVRRIHTSFSGPGTGERYEKLVRSFNDTVDALLDE
jgi:peroxiredoxin